RWSGSSRSSVCSTRARPCVINASSATSVGVVIGVEIFRFLVVLQQDANLLLCGLQRLLCFARQAHALFEGLQGFLQRQVTGLHFFHQRLKRFQGFLEVG